MKQAGTWQEDVGGDDNVNLIIGQTTLIRSDRKRKYCPFVHAYQHCFPS